MDIPPGAHLVYPFKLRDELTGRWYLARWKDRAESIEKRGGVIAGPPEVIRPIGAWHSVGTHGPTKPRPGDEVDTAPSVDELEAALARIFLRRYVTYCARTRRHAQAGGAAALWRTLSVAQGVTGG